MALSTIAQTGPSVARRTVEAQLRGRRYDPAGIVLKAALGLGIGLAIASLLILLWDVLVPGVAPLNERGWWGFVSEGDTTRASSTGVFKALRGTFWIGIFVVILAFPIGIGAAIYLEEYAKKESKLSSFIELNIRNLAGVPSVVYGILGLFIFVEIFQGFFGDFTVHRGRTVAAAGATLAVLVLPIIIITASEALRAVPQALREAGYGVGATQWEVTRHHVLPYAAPGILTGTLLALARALGEAAPLIVVGGVLGSSGSRAGLFDFSQLGEGFTAMPLEIARLTQKGQIGSWSSAAAASIVILLIVVLLANAVAIFARGYFEKKRG